MYLLNYTEACNEFAQPISASLRPAGPPRGGQGGQWHRGPWSLGSPWAREEVHPNDIEKWKTHRNLMWRLEKSLKFRRRLFFFFEITWFLPEKPLKFRWKPFFFLLEITSVFRSNSSIFSVYFGLHITRIPSCWSWPRAHVWLSAPLAPGQHSFFWTIVTMVANRWQHCVWFDQPEIWIADLPLQKQTCYRSTNWLV